MQIIDISYNLMIIQIRVVKFINILFQLLMINKPSAATESVDISWIQKDVQCWIHIPHQERSPIFIKGVIKGIIPLSFNVGNSKVMCTLENGSQYDSKAINVQKRRYSNSIQKDLISLDVINGAQIIYQLKKRFEDKKIHTYIWNSLIIINPFQKIQGMYDQKIMQGFYEKVIISKKKLHQIQPHIYGFVCSILNDMKNSQKVQMISISGESGAGKTETNKQCLKIISYICQKHLKKEGTPDMLIEQRILHCDNVLECFGNSKTSKNDNSSRFGKLITQKINMSEMQVLNFEVKAFFLEKSRVVHQIKGQRNFHIFYLLLNFASEQLKNHLGLKSSHGMMKIADFHYLGEKSITMKQDDRVRWQNLLESFRILQVNDITRYHIFQIIAAILHMGNIQFDESTLTDNDPCEISNYSRVLETLQKLLKLKIADLKQGLVYNKKVIAGDTLYLPMSQKQCIEARDSIAKALYENLFIWIVEQLNKKVNEVKRPEKNVKVIKMLDIYGFEVFEFNSFEQLCVNYTNEKMHQIYLNQVFKHEKMLLKKEGLESIIPQMKFTDNSRVIQLLDTNVKSVFNLLDESCSVNVKDEDFLTNVKKYSEGHQCFPSSNNISLKKCFIINHTPGEIQYMAEGFRNKNKDFLREDIIEKLTHSKSPIIGQRFSKLLETVRSEINKKFLGFKMRKQVNALINQMSFNSDMHFIRCIKPNDEKQGLRFVERVSYNQIKYLGVLDTARMRKDTYHVRIPYPQFYKKYGILEGNIDRMISLDNGKVSDLECKQLTKNLIENKFKGVNLDYLMGTEKIFMKMETNNYLESYLKQRTKKISHSSTIMKATFRNRYKREERKQFTVHVRKVQMAIRSYLKDIIFIKKKNAVKIIQTQWMKRSNTFFNRKKLIFIKAVQKYIKKIVQKKDYEQQHKSIQVAKNILTTMRETHAEADKVQKFLLIRKEFDKNIYNMIWKKMVKLYVNKIQLYMKTLSTIFRNQDKISSANQRTKNRLILINRQNIKKYLLTIHWSRQFQKLHNSAVQIQKNIKTYLTKIRKRNLTVKAKKIQRCWRNYQIIKDFTQFQISKFYSSVQDQELQWKSQLFRNLNTNNITSTPIGIEKILDRFEKIRKDKIVLFYYLLDYQIFSQDPSLEGWIENYLSLTEETLIKMNPIQMIDVSNTRTAATTTNKLYTWGESPKYQQQQVQGKLNKIIATDAFTKVETINPFSQVYIGSSTINQQKQLNREWFTCSLNFVILNGLVVTIQDTSFTKLNIKQKITQLSCGMSHVICKTILKKVFTWGKNSCGQLGIGHFFQLTSFEPVMVQYFFKKRINVNQVAASPQSSIVIDLSNKIYWFGSNGTIKNKCTPEQCHLVAKSSYIGNYTKYSPVKIISRWSKTLSLIGIIVACHDEILKNQISLRKKVLQNIMTKWSQDFSLINPPYFQSVADHISQRHMPLPSINKTQGGTVKTQNNKEIRQKIILDLHRIEEAEQQLLRNRNNQKKIQSKSKRKY